ncbi:hypothetical protein, partial [Acidithiobacillus ferrianus]|uniref:hypothetical protein n=1 Tax=Acidithiobacillus ferrianus TaxID=2678518 RepID=UPI0034E506BD
MSNLWLNVEALTCSGFFFLSLWWCVLVFSWLKYFCVKASGEGRRCAHRALLLFPSLLLFSSVSYGASSVSGIMYVGSCTFLTDSICVSQADINSGFSASSTVVDSLSSSSCTVTF